MFFHSCSYWAGQMLGLCWRWPCPITQQAHCEKSGEPEQSAGASSFLCQVLQPQPFQLSCRAWLSAFTDNSVPWKLTVSSSKQTVTEQAHDFHYRASFLTRCVCCRGLCKKLNKHLLLLAEQASDSPRLGFFFAADPSLENEWLMVGQSNCAAWL